MEGGPERQPEFDGLGYRPEMVAFLTQLRQSPGTRINCIHPDGQPAFGIYDVPEGCAVFGEDETQPLCQQHVNTDGSKQGMRLVVDLSVNGAWSKLMEVVPDYYLSLADGAEDYVLTRTQPAA